MDLEELYRLLRRAHVQAANIIDTIQEPLLVLDGRFSVIQASRSFCEKFRVDREKILGQPLFDIGKGIWKSHELRLLLAEVIPKSTAIIDFEVTGDFPDIGRRTMLVNARRMLNPEEGVTNILLSISDATERRRKEADSDVLLAEMQHRMKNLLSLVQAIAAQTTTQGRSAEEYRKIFLDRFQAMVRAHDLAFAVDGADLRALVVHAIEPYKTNADALLIEESPKIILPAGSIVSMHLLVHELATNAVKHGALSVPQGRVTVRWDLSREDQKQLHFFWHEEGGPPVVQIGTRNFGTRLIEHAARTDLGGRAELNFKPEGLQAEIVMPFM